MEIKDIIKKLRLMKTFPKVEVRMCGDSECKESFNYFTRHHSKYKIIQNKKWGVAMLKLPDTFEEYKGGKSKQMLRKKRNRAIAKGYTVKTISPLDHLEEIMTIHRSTGERQGRPMDEKYLHKEKVEKFFLPIPFIHGVFDQNGTLQAYGHFPCCGEVFFFNRLLGHQSHLDNGVMYLLISEVIREMIEGNKRNDKPLWAMYDTFLGASEGLRYFKDRLGFSPYNVKWVWESRGDI